MNIDLAPTFLDIAGLDKPGHMDGVSMLPILSENNDNNTGTAWREAFLIERGKLTFQRCEMLFFICISDDLSNAGHLE